MDRRRRVELWISMANHLMAGRALLARCEHGMVTWGEWEALMRGEAVRHRQIAPIVRVG